MPLKAVHISIDREFLRRIDRDSEAREKGRSAFIRAAVEFYLSSKERQKIDEQLTRAYKGQADAMIDEVAELIDDQEDPNDTDSGPSSGP